MNTTSNAARIFAATFAIAITGAAALVLDQVPQQDAQQQIVRLERVVIVGKRTPDATELAAAKVEYLPRVVIEGRRADTQVASAKACPVTAVC